MSRPTIRIRPKALWDFIDRHGISQNQLADQLDVSRGYVSQMLNHRRNPSPRMRRLLADFTGLDFDELFEFVPAAGFAETATPYATPREARRYNFRDRLAGAGFSEREIHRFRTALSAYDAERRRKASTRELRGRDAGLHVRSCSYPLRGCRCRHFPDQARTQQRWHVDAEAEIPPPPAA